MKTILIALLLWILSFLSFILWAAYIGKTIPSQLEKAEMNWYRDGMITGTCSEIVKQYPVTQEQCEADIGKKISKY